MTAMLFAALILTALAASLKLAGVLSWSWLLIGAPVWLALAMFVWSRVRK